MYCLSKRVQLAALFIPRYGPYSYTGRRRGAGPPSMRSLSRSLAAAARGSQTLSRVSGLPARVPCVHERRADTGGAGGGAPGGGRARRRRALHAARPPGRQPRLQLAVALRPHAAQPRRRGRARRGRGAAAGGRRGGPGRAGQRRFHGPAPRLRVVPGGGDDAAHRVLLRRRGARRRRPHALRRARPPARAAGRRGRREGAAVAARAHGCSRGGAGWTARTTRPRGR